MTFKTVAGGFDLSVAERSRLNTQRAITKAVNDSFIQVGAVYLKTSSKNPISEDWAKSKHRDVNLQSWIDDPQHAYYNVGFNLQSGWVDIDIDADDPLFNYCILAALTHNGVDTRFKFGRESVGVATHVMAQLGEAESANFDALKVFEPKEFRMGGKRYHVQVRSYPSGDGKDGTAKQTVMPGSVYTHKHRPGQPDFSVWYGPTGKVAEKIQQVATTTPRRVNFNEIVRSIAFGTMLYVLNDKWVEGSRQSVAHVVCGWLARVAADSYAMNNHEVISKDVFCPVDDDATVESLIKFICHERGDEEVHMRIRAYYDAKEKLTRNPDAKIPGWPAMEKLLSGERVAAIRTVFTPGSDVSILTKMAERYVYDEADNKYIDRDRFFSGGNFTHETTELLNRHKGDNVRIGGKPKEAFRLYESSDMRKRVGGRDFYPDLVPGSINRVSNLGEYLSDDDDTETGTLPIFNTWRGWAVQPAETVDQALLEDLTTRLDKLLGYLTRDNEEQIKWLKCWIAWIIQHPGDKQQIAPVIVGGQGVGKSWLGNIFMKAVFGPLWGVASPKVLEGDFVVSPFKDKMFVFIDEAKFSSEQGVEEIKKLIRGVDVPGMEKFMDARSYRLFARIMFASNRMDVNVGQANVRDRALFYTRAYDKDYLGMSEMQFRAWAETLKPWFDEYTTLMKRRDVKEHYMRMFLDWECSRYTIESIKYSSGGDASIVLSNMSWARRIAKHIIEDGRIFEDLDITYPFTISDLNRRVAEVSRELGLREVQGTRVFNEFQDAGVLESVVVHNMRKIRFKWKMKTLIQEFGKAIAVELEERYVFNDSDEGANSNDGSERKPWRGGKVGVVAGSKF